MLYSFESLNSTSDFLKENFKNYNEFDIISTKIQPKGRGRQGSTWFSEKGMALFTFYFNLPSHIKVDDITKIPIITAISIINTLKNMENLQFKIKWSNDIYLNEKKLGGILVEQIENKIFIGIGLNVNNSIPEEIKNIAISLKNVTNNNYNLENLINSIVNNFKDTFFNFCKNKHVWRDLLTEINKINYLKDKNITLNIGNELIEGIAKNIDINGNLEILYNGKIVSFSSGEVLKKRFIINFDSQKFTTNDIIDLKNKGFDLIIILFISAHISQKEINIFDDFCKEHYLKNEKIFLNNSENINTYLQSLCKKYNAQLHTL